MQSSRTSEQARHRRAIQRLIAELASIDPEHKSYEPKLALLGERIARPSRERQRRMPGRGRSILAAEGAGARGWRAAWHRQKARMTLAGGALLRALKGAVTGSQEAGAGSRPGPAIDSAVPDASTVPGTSADAATSGGRFTQGRFGKDSPRSYWLYEPASRNSGPAPLLVVLHGCNQNAEDFAAGTRMNQAAGDAGAFVLYPEQSVVANPLRCWNWYALQDPSNGAGDAALIAAMTRQVMGEHDIDPARVYVAGMSAGGAMAAVLARDYPKLYAALGVHSGVPAGLAHDVYSAMRLMSDGPRQRDGDASPMNDVRRHAVASIVFHGDEDTTVHPSNGEAIHAAPGIARARPLPVESVSATTRPGDGQRGFTRSVELGPDGVTSRELWIVHGAGHAWSGGSDKQRHTDPAGPDASREMMRFFLQHQLPFPAA